MSGVIVINGNGPGKTVVTQTPGVGPPSTPPGGTPGQILRKASATDHDTEWATVSGTGDMVSSIYDPQGVLDDAFALPNMTGSLDLGTFL